MIQDSPFLNLKTYKYKKVLDGNANGVDDFYKKIIEDQFKNIKIIEQQHTSIIKYVQGASPTFFIRLYGSYKRSDYNLQRRGFLSQYLNGTKTVFCDNTFSLLFSGMKLAGISYTCDDLNSFLTQKNLKVGFAQVSQEKDLAYYTPKDAIKFDLNSLGWYQAHVHPVGAGYLGLSIKNYFPNPDRSEFDVTTKKRILNHNLSQLELDVLKAHFIRLIHPFNSFLVPKNSHLEYDGSNLGEEPELINYVQEKIKFLFANLYHEFESLALLENDFSVVSNKKLNKIKWYNNKKMKNDEQSIRMAKGDLLNPNEINARATDIIHKATRFYVDEKIYIQLKKSVNAFYRLIVNPNKGKHPKGTYVIPNAIILNFIESKRKAYNWERNNNFHQDSIPKQLREFFFE